MTTAIVVGAGIGGLTAAYDLARAGVVPLVLDGRDAPGGSVRAHVVGGLTLDAGAESFAVKGGHVAALVDDLGMTDRLVGPDPRGAWVQLADAARPMPRGGVLGVPAHPWHPDTRRAIGVGGAARAALDLVLPARVGAGAGSIAEQVGARMGTRVVERLVHPVVGGVYGADPADVTLTALAPQLAERLGATRGSLVRAARAASTGLPAGSAVQGLVGGMHTLTAALVAAIEAAGGRVLTRAAVVEVAREADGWRVSTADAEHRADLLVLAAPALAGVPGLDAPEPDAGRPVTVVTLVVDDARLDAAPRGTGLLVAPGHPSLQAKALTHATVKWPWLAELAGPGRHVLRLSYDGDRGADAAARAAIVEHARDDAEALLGQPVADPAASGVVRWTQALPRPSAAHRAAVDQVRDAVAANPGLAATGGWVAGTGLAAVVAHARTTAKDLLDGIS